MANSPPLPKRFTKQYREELATKQKNEQARIQYEEAQRKYEQEKAITDRRNALVEKYNKGSLSFAEYKELTGSSSLENYYYYIAPRDPAEGDRIAAQLYPGGYGPIYGGKSKNALPSVYPVASSIEGPDVLITNTGELITPGPASMNGLVGFVPYIKPKQPKQQEEFLIASSVKGPDVFITNKGNEATRIPASFMDRSERFTLEKPVIPYSKNITDKRLIGGYSKEAYIPKTFELDIPGKKVYRQGLENLNVAADRLIYTAGYELGKASYGPSKFFQEKSPFRQGSFFGDFYTETFKPKDNFTPYSEKEAAQRGVIFGDVGLKLSYLAPIYGEYKVFSESTIMASKKDYSFIEPLAIGAFAFGSLRLVNKGLIKLEKLPKYEKFEFVSPQAAKQLEEMELKGQLLPGKKYPFVGPKAIKQLAEMESKGLFAKEKKIEPLVLTPKEFKPDYGLLQRNFASGMIGATFLAPEIAKSVGKTAGITTDNPELITIQRETLFRKSRKEAINIGLAKLGYDVADYGFLRLKPLAYSTYFKLKGMEEIDYRPLESPQYYTTGTSYPKATMDVFKFKEFVESTKNRPFFKKYFEALPQAFNVSKGSLGKEYIAAPGTSEIYGQYFAPIYPSFSFGIPKERTGISEQLEGYAPFPKFDLIEGTPVANIAYGKGVKIVDITGKGKDVLTPLEPGYFYIPAKGKLRSKSESEVIQNTRTRFFRANQRYFTVYKGKLAQDRGFPFGVVFEIPEYYVEGLTPRKGITLEKKSISEEGLNKIESEQRNYYENYYKYRTPLTVNYTARGNKFSDYSSKDSKKSFSYLAPIYSDSKKSGAIGFISRSSLEKRNYRSYGLSNISRNNYRPRYPSGYSPPSIPRYESPPSTPRYPPSPPSYPRGSSYDYLGKSRGPSPPSRGYYYPPSNPPGYPGDSRKRDQSYPSMKRDAREFGFIPVLYKGGKPIKTLTNRPLVRSEAIAFGANIVNSLTKRSFKLVRAGTAIPYGIKGPVDILRPGKRDRFLFVERSKYAINTRGEKYGLRQARLTKKRGFRL